MIPTTRRETVVRIFVKRFREAESTFVEQLNGLENKKPESGNPGTMRKTETLAETRGFLNLLVGCID